MIGKTAFLFSRVLLLLLVLVVGVVTAEIVWLGVVTVDAGVLEWGTWKDRLPLFCGPALVVLCLVGLKYVFRPPVQRVRYWIVLAVFLVVVGVAGFFYSR